MTPDPIRLLAREGLETLHQGAPDAPEWDEITAIELRPSVRRGSRWMRPALAIGMAAVVALLVLISPQGDPEVPVPTLNEPVAPSVTPGTSVVTTTLPQANVPSGLAPPVSSSFEVATPIQLRLFAADPNRATYSIIDLSTGTTTTFGPRSHRIGNADGMVADTNRRFVIWSFEGVYVVDDDLAAPLTVWQEEDLGLRGFDHSLRAVPTWAREGLWIVSPGGVFGEIFAPTRMVLAGISDRQLGIRSSTEGNALPVAATESGLVLNTEDFIESELGFVTEPGSERVLHMLTDGTVVDLGPGVAIAASPNRIAILECPADQQKCNPYAINELQIIGPGAPGGRVVVEKPLPGTWLRVGGPIIPSDAMPLQTVSPDGVRMLVRLGQDLDVNGVPETSQLIVVDLEAHEARVMASYERERPVSLATWSSDGQWIVVFDRPEPGRMAATVFDAESLEVAVVFDDLIPDGQFLLAAG